jgi:predicted RNase H-like HicB family nuclease
MKYTAIIEQGETSYGAYVPDLPGCIAAGETRDEALVLIKEAIEFHLEDLRASGGSMPAPTASAKLSMWRRSLAERRIDVDPRRWSVGACSHAGETGQVFPSG